MYFEAKNLYVLYRIVLKFAVILSLEFKIIEAKYEKNLSVT